MMRLIGAIFAIALFISNSVFADEWLIPQSRLSQIEYLSEENVSTLINLLQLRKANEDRIGELELYYVENRFYSPEQLEKLVQRRYSGVISSKDIPNPEVKFGQIMQSPFCKYYRNTYTNSLAVLEQKNNIVVMQHHIDREYLADTEVYIHREETTFSGDNPPKIPKKEVWNIVSKSEDRTKLDFPDLYTSTSFEYHTLERKIYDILSATSIIKTIEKDTTEDGIHLVKIEIEYPKHGEIQKLSYSLDHGGLMYQNEWIFSTNGKSGPIERHNKISDVSFQKYKDGNDSIYLAKSYLHTTITNGDVIEQRQFILNTEASKVNSGIPLERFKIGVNAGDVFRDSQLGIYSDFMPAKYTLNSLPNRYKRYLFTEEKPLGFLKQNETQNQSEKTYGETSKVQPESIDQPYKTASANFSDLILDQYQNSPEPKIHKKSFKTQ